MSRHVSLGKRILAMALVLVLVLSYVPAGTFAVATKHVDAMTAVITRTGDAAPYTYTLTVTKTVEGNPENVVPDSVIWTEVGDAPISTINTEITYESAAEEVAAEFTYGNLSGKVEYKAETANSIDYSAAEDAAWADKTVYVGVPFAIPTTTENGGITGAQLTTAANSENVDEVDGEYIPKKASDTPIVLLTQQLENNDDIMATKEYSAKVEYPALDSVVFKIGEQQISGITWINNATELTVQVVDAQVVSADYLPAVKVGDAAQPATWTGEGTEANPWSCTVAVNENTTISLLDSTVSINVDNVLPSITNGKAYVNGEGNTYVSFDYNDNGSGFHKVTVGGEVFTDEQTPPGKFSTTLSGEMTTVTVELTDVAGNVQTLEIPVQPKLTASVTASAAVNTVETTSYYNADNQLTLTVDVAGATEGGEYDVASVTGTANEGAVVMDFVKGEDGKYVYTYTGADISLSGITVTVTDAMGRTATSALAGTYVYDTIAPTLELTATANGEDAGMLINGDGDKIYLGIDQPNGLEKVTFKIEGTVADANYQGAAFCVEKEALADAVTAILVAGTIEDLAGNKLATVTLKAGENSCGIDVDANGAFSKELLADLQKPYSTEATLEIIITDSEDADTFTGKLYNEDNLTFKAQIVDGEGAGINQVTYSLVGVENSTKTATLNAAGYYEFPLKDFLANTEANVTLQVTASDNLNNQNSKSVTFAVDTKAPEAVATMPTGAKNQVDGVDYYDEVQTVVITVTDANFDSNATSVVYKINGEEQNAIAWNGNVGTIEIADGEIFSDLAYTIKDQAGHESIGSKIDKFCVDTTDPVIDITMPGTAAQTVGGVDYYNAPQQVVITVTDANFDAANSAVNYKVNGAAEVGTWDGNTCTIEIADGEVFSDLKVYAKDYATRDITEEKTAIVCVDTTAPDIDITMPGAAAQTVGGVDYYNAEQTVTITVTDTNIDLDSRVVSYEINGTAEIGTWDGNTCTIEIADGETFSNLKVEAKDYATNEASKEETAVICVDTTDPVIEITMPNQPALMLGGVEYYGAEQTVTIKVSDANIDMASCTVSYEINGAAEVGTWEGNTCTIQITDGQLFSNLEVYAKDYATNDITEEKTTAICVDTTAPTAEVNLEGEIVDTFYVYNNVVYVKLKNPAKVASGEADTSADESITLTVTVKDNNLSVNENTAGFYLKNNLNNGETWTGDTFINKDSTLVYTDTVAVAADDTDFLSIDLSVIDLAGNALKAEGTKAFVNGTESEELQGEVAPDASGRSNAVVVLDRRRPTSSDDKATPVIVVDPSITNTTSNNGLELFNGEFTFDVTVNDGTEESYNSGLESVYWQIVDANAVVTGGEQTLDQADGTYSTNIQIPVTMTANPGETNDVQLKIIAVDNVGNTITYTKQFAVDTKAPVVEVTKSGTRVREVTEGESKVDLFNGEVTYTATVEDINLADCVLTYTLEGKSETSVSVKENQWTQDPANENKYSCSFTLEDGDVLTALKVEAQDKAGNETTEVTSTETFTGTQYTGNYVAVDMTAPAVTVTKSVEDEKQFVQNIENIDLYNGNVTYTVKVEDQFLTSDNGAKAVVRYRLEGKDWTELNLFDNAPDTNSILSNNMDVFTTSFTLEDGNVLVALDIEVMDNAGHEAEAVNVTNAERTSFAYLDDVLGKRNVYTGYLVAVDKTAPAVTATKTVEENKQYVQTIDVDTTEIERNIDFYDGKVTYTFKVEDQFLTRDLGAEAVVRYMLEGDEDWTVLNLFDYAKATNSITSNNVDVLETSITLEDNQTLVALEVKAVDNVGNKETEVTVVDGDGKTTFDYDDADNTHTYTGNDVRVDKTVPVVSVEKTVEAEKSYIQSSEKTDYYNGEVTYKVTASDINLTNAAEQKQQMNLTYQFEGDEAETVIALPAAESGWTWQKGENGEDTYAYEFTVEDGKVLTKFEIQVVDNAGNKAQSVDVINADEKTAFADNNADGIHTYTGKLVAVDKTAPVVTVEKTGTSIQSYDGHDYYDGAISYKVTVKDTFLNKLEKSIANVVVTYMDGTKSQNVNLLSSAAAFGEKESDMDSYEAVFEVADGDAIMDIQIIAVDNADNNAKEVGVTDADNLTTFQYLEENRTLDYTGNVAVVDMTAPTAKVEITGQIVDSFYTYNGVTYVRLKNPGKAQSGEYTGQADETVTLKVTVSDKNLTLDTQNVYGVKNNLTDGIAWAGTPAKNQDGTVTYTKSVTVPADSTGIIEFSLTVFDLAGNAVSEVKVASINDTDSTKINEQIQPKNGVFGTTISLDRRRPSSVDDNNAPVIVVKPSISNTISNNNLELFNGAFNFALNVTDGQNNANNSGIDKVQWIIEDAVGFVKFNDTMNDLEDGVYNQSFTIPVELVNAIGESNSVKITIIATDNVGNITEYVKDFAVDTQKPAVVVSYDNNDVMNGKYFKADRKVTITVSDINFEPTTTTITSQVNSTGWSKNGDVYTTTCTYNVDGIYTLDMVTTDRANNTADIDFTNNGINAAPTDFVLDKTAPVIDVSYSPANPVDRDGNGVHYFNANRNLTVTITEVNFDPANQTTKLVANLGANNALGAWRSNGDVHTASETFTEGNNYQVKIDYTDLAGNPAVSYSSETFSVDLGEPTIEITSGELTNDGLNIVQDDLVLGFTINDKQNNLKNFKATLLFLDKEFKQQEVTGAAYYTVAGENNRTTGTVTFTNIAKEKINDGIYTVQLTAEDYAGHKVELAPELVFSLNRFGSTFVVEDEVTRQFLTAAEDGNVYQNRASTLKIIERNPNKVYQSAESKEEGSLITISVNGNSIQLSKGVDYMMDVSEKGTGANKWYEYTYEILASNFFDGDTQIDGRYEILFYSVDAAGNSNTNESNEGSNIQSDAQGGYTGKLSFMLDHKAPVLSILDLNEKGGTTFDAAYKRVPISISDNTPCTIEVYIDDVLVELKESLEGLADNANWLAPDGQGGYILNISASDTPQDVRVLIMDAAGNVIEQSRQRVLVSDNFWVRYINNYWAVGGTIAGLVALVVVVILLAKKGKKKEEQ